MVCFIWNLILFYKIGRTKEARGKRCQLAICVHVTNTRDSIPIVEGMVCFALRLALVTIAMQDESAKQTLSSTIGILTICHTVKLQCC